MCEERKNEIKGKGHKKNFLKKRIRKERSNGRKKENNQKKEQMKKFILKIKKGK